MLTFHATDLHGVILVESGEHRDERGGFSRLFCVQAFADAGIDFTLSQMNLSTNHRRHTLRGMHYQAAPHEEAKIVRVVSGTVYDVVMDMRRDSPTCGKWQGFRLDAASRKALYIPKGCAHGFLTLEDDTTVLYQMDAPFVPGTARGLRYDDPAFGAVWPAEPEVISPKDLDWPAHSG